MCEGMCEGMCVDSHLLALRHSHSLTLRHSHSGRMMAIARLAHPSASDKGLVSRWKRRFGDKITNKMVTAPSVSRAYRAFPLEAGAAPRCTKHLWKTLKPLTSYGAQLPVVVRRGSDLWTTALANARRAWS